MKLIVSIVVFAASLAPALADAVEVPAGAIPASVKAAVDCSLMREDAIRSEFHGRVLFAFECAGNNQNAMRALVLASDAAGQQAVGLKFPATAYSGGAKATEISNPRLFGDTGSIGEIYVDTEAKRGTACRFETLYRIKSPTDIRIVFARQSVTCDASAKRWRVTRDVRTPAEKTQSWE